eukprot:421577-Rhodomonas_salina.1
MQLGKKTGKKKTDVGAEQREGEGSRQSAYAASRRRFARGTRIPPVCAYNCAGYAGRRLGVSPY